MGKCKICGAPVRFMPPDGDLKYDPPRGLRTAPSPGPGTTFADGLKAAAKAISAVLPMFRSDRVAPASYAMGHLTGLQDALRIVRTVAPPVPQVSGEGETK